MKDLLLLPKITVPVTLVCAGNRRKEQVKRLLIPEHD
jgi:hypothetical protein